MIGNDVVDLQLAHQESTIYKRGWLNKLFTLPEQSLIHEAEDAEYMVWLLWSMKEAVYKIVNRDTGRRFYAPLSFTCQLSLLTDGQRRKKPILLYGSVNYKGTCYRTLTYQQQESLHTVASYADMDPRIFIIRALDTYISNLRTDLIVSLLKSTPYRLMKNMQGHPFLEHKASGFKVPASMSHHGKYLALCWIETYQN